MSHPHPNEIIARDPAVPENVVSADPHQVLGEVTIISEPQGTGWTVTRVYSEYTSREVFVDPKGIEWVRVSVQAFNPGRGDIKIACRTRGLQPILLRRRDAFVANLRKGDL